MVVGATTLAACGSTAGHAASGAASPSEALGQAFFALGESSSIDASITLKVTPQQLVTMSGHGGSTPISLEEANAITASTIVVDADTGNQQSINDQAKATTPDTAGQAEAELQVNGSTPVDLRLVNQVVYLRADLNSLASTYGGQVSSAIDELHKLSALGAFVPGVSAAMKGDWVSADLAQVMKLAGLPGGTSTPDTFSPTLLHDLSAVVEQGVTVHGDGDHNGRTQYTVTGNLKPLLEQLLTTLTKDAPAGSKLGPLSEAQSSLSKIPANATLAAQVWVSQGRAQEIMIDLNQVDHYETFQVPLDIVIGGGAQVNVPSGATPLDISGLSTLFHMVNG
jgi:hypothetical protein